MPLKPMTYETTLHTPLEATYATVYAQQLQYFQHFDAAITELSQGVAIDSEMRTKVQQAEVPTHVEVLEVVDNAVIATKVSYSQGEIITRYEFAKAPDGTKLTYSEQNSFTKNSLTTNFWLVGWVYTFMYKHNLKRRMQAIEQLTQAAAG
ncbi:DUF3284 domain-containing protein [Lacticaseibacillus suihuaensis]